MHAHALFTSPLARGAAPAATRRALSQRCALSLASPPADVDALRRAYAQDGWVCLRAVLSAAELAELHAAVDSLEAAAAGLQQSARLDGVFYEVQSASGRKGEPALRAGLLRKATGPSRRWAAFARLRSQERLRGWAEALLGRRVRCVVDQANTKQAGVGTGFPWHQDASFLGGEAKRSFAANGGVNAVLALDASDAENGGFEVLSGTHKGPLLDLRGVYDTSSSGDGRFDTSGRALPTLQPGDALLFHPLLAHGSGANASTRRRRLATLWFVGVAERE